MPGGRPSKYKPEFCQELIEAGKEGYSIEAFAGKIGVSRECIYEWTRVHPEFSDAKKVFETASQRYWESVGKLGMLGQVKNFNAAVWIFSMKNRFKWRDVTTVETDPTDSPPAFVYETEWGNPSEERTYKPES